MWLYKLSASFLYEGVMQGTNIKKRSGCCVTLM